MFRRRNVENDQRPRRRLRPRRAAARDRDGETTHEATPEQAAEHTWRSRGVLMIGGGVLAIARLVMFVAAIVALIIGAAIVLRVLSANSGNSVVSAIHDAGRALVGPFDGMFRLHDTKATLAVNWGIALLVYLVAGSLIAGYLRRLAGAGRRAARGLRTRTA